MKLDPRHHRRFEQGTARHWKLVRDIGLGLSLILLCQGALAQAVYRIKPIGSLGGCPTQPPVANAFNAADQVTGQACNASGDFHAFLWKNDGTAMLDLGPAEKGSRSSGNDINASGLVAGSAEDSTGQYGFISAGGPMTKIVNSLGGAGSAALALNASGQVTGWADSTGGATDAFVWKDNGSGMTDLGNQGQECCANTAGTAINASAQVAGTSGDYNGTYRAFIWRNNGTPLLDLGDLGGYRNFACCINAAGEVAGSSSVSGASHFHAYLWRNDGTGMHDLGTLAKGSLSEANALNSSGQVVGWSTTRFYRNQHAFIWLNNGNPMKDLGTFGGTTSSANDVNPTGQVTGYASLTGDVSTHAFLWRNDGGKIVDLNNLIDSADPLKPYVTLTSGDFINASGDIVAEGTDSRTGKDGLYVLQGTVLTLSPRSLAFGNQPINTTSAAKSVTVTNTSAKAVAITSIAVTGANSGQFGSTNNCGSSLAGHATCTIKVTFKPTSKGAKSAALNVNGGGGGLRSVKLTGTGT